MNPRLSPIGLLGFFHCDNDDEGSARAVLLEGAAWLREQGAEVVRGPMAYSTWNDYRFVVERTEPGSFRGEPDHPDFYPRLWERAGFAPVSHYASHWIDMDEAQSRWVDKVARAREVGVTVRTVTDSDIPSIYQLSLAGFRDAYMFSPIDPDEFVSIYGGPRSPDSRTTIAHLDGRAVGFMHTFIADLPRGRTGIAKTIAVVPEARDRGVYHALFSDALTSFQSAGLTHAIAALMHVDGSPALMGWARGPLYKQYALYQLI